MVNSEPYKKIAADSMNRERNLPNLRSSDYYWDRKRREVVSLIRRNDKEIGNADLVVELGCGTGRDIWSIRDALGLTNVRFECVDAFGEDLELAQARKAFHGADNVHFFRHDVTQTLPWEDESVDLAYCSEVFEHIPEAEVAQLVGEVARVIKRGGYFLLTTPNEPNVFQRSFYSKKRRRKIAALNAEPKKFAEDGTPLYGHVSLKKNSEWDKIMVTAGFELADYGRGAIWYGGTEFHDGSFALAVQFAVEGMLDLLPRRVTRNISDQVIALYKRK